MKRFDDGLYDDVDEAEIIGEMEDSEILRQFSLKSKEGEEYEANKIKKFNTWRKNHKDWVKKEKSNKAKFIKNVVLPCEVGAVKILIAPEGNSKGSPPIV